MSNAVDVIAEALHVHPPDDTDSWEGRSAEWVVTALVAAGFDLSEPVFEYGYELIESDTRAVFMRNLGFPNVESAQHSARKDQVRESDTEFPPLEILMRRRRIAGPWVEVTS